ncbi:MAG: type 1 glutamine amidotransferase [Rhodobacteraceae bacterium]|nr:type 1 glutamine amidotransferase [Paracoccaceae bacterium]
MAHILIVDSNPAEHYAKRRAAAAGRAEDAVDGMQYGEVLRALDPAVRYRVVAPYDDPALPDLSGLDGVVFTGSGVDWSTDDPRAAPLADTMRRVFDAGLPVFGSCNGMLLAATVLGGNNRVSPNGREDGLARDIRLTPEGAAHPMMAGRRDGFAVPCVHRDEVETMPPGAVVLARNDHSPVQAFAYERGGVRFWGVQYHPEYSPLHVAGFVESDGRLPETICDALRRCQEDAAAAALLGTTPEEQAPASRRIELGNWLKQL